MMKKIPLIIISSLFLLNGCALFGGGEDTATTPPPIPPQTPTPTENPDTQEIPTTTPSNIQGIGSLILPTNPEKRLGLVESGRSDPFDSITPPAIVKVKATQIPSSPQKALLVEKPMNENIRALNTPTQNFDRNNGKSPTPKDSSIAKQPTESKGQTVLSMNEITKVSPPTPDEANAILVSGIVNINGEKVALIQTPDENSFRQVKEGDFLNVAGKSIYVKNVSLFPKGPQVMMASNSQLKNIALGGVDGYITLEQYGQRVIRRVGQPTVTPEIPKPPAS